MNEKIRDRLKKGEITVTDLVRSNGRLDERQAAAFLDHIQRYIDSRLEALLATGCFKFLERNENGISTQYQYMWERLQTYIYDKPLNHIIEGLESESQEVEYRALSLNYPEEIIRKRGGSCTEQLAVLLQFVSLEHFLFYQNSDCAARAVLKDTGESFEIQASTLLDFFDQARHELSLRGL